MDKIAVLIPCYNEALTVEKVVSDFKTNLPQAKIYVYDNNSSDDTYDLAVKAGAIVRKEYRQGKGNVVRSMFRDINAECYILVDGDDTYPAKHAQDMADMVLNDNVDMVVGDRLSTTYFTENKRPFHNSGNVLVRWLVNVMFKGNIKDIMSGYRAFSYLFAKSYPIVTKGFELETDMTIFALDKNLLVRATPIEYSDRPEGSFSKLNTFRDGFKVLKTIFRLCKNYRPLTFFGIIALILFLVGGGAFVTVLVDYLRTGLVLRFPTLFVSLFIILTSIMSLVCGLILETVASINRKSYELRFIQVKEHFAPPAKEA
ncbi:MAG: glycosyltransferase [Defluviitaleaceae bacterium]|nr:glycosyltransferase [Defluviitaleaceae bacterium]